MTESPLRLLIVHSSAELYGSDRSLLDFVLHCGVGMQITVALPEQGLLVRELEQAGANVIVGDVCKIQRGMLSPLGLLRAAVAAWRALRFLDSACRSNGFDLVYSNTVAVLGGALLARRRGIPHVWHVREIMARSRILTAGFRRLVATLSRTVVCNSEQTLDWIRLKGAGNKYLVVWNGFDAPIIETDRQVERARLGADDGDLLFVLVGRINAWKGQKLLVEAFAQLLAGTKLRARLAIVGSAPAGQEHYEHELKTVIEQSDCAEQVTLIPYRADINPVWIAADVVVVPSTEPEPFGRVAIEAMAFGRPVIAAKHGGLVEIVVDGETGRLIAPRDAKALATAMKELLLDFELRQRMGEAGRVRQRALFSVEGYASQMTDVMRVSRAKPCCAGGLNLLPAKTAEKTVLFVHQSAEMYGSDKVLLSLVLGMDGRGIHPIVLLPEKGPLFTALNAGDIETYITPVTKLNRETLSLKGLIKLPINLTFSMWAINKILKRRHIDLVYSNTLAVLGAAVWAKFNRIPHLWHVHELLRSPLIARRSFPWLLRLLADKVVCNSTMTEQWVLIEQPSLAARTQVIWNGQGQRPPANKNVAIDLRKSLGVADEQLLVALVGRINHWKGQELLISAAATLWQRGFRDLHYLLVGGCAAGQECLIERLKQQIADSPVRENVHILPFTNNVWSIWDACDIAVVPSTEPEPFGLVAIEAMSSRKPVVVAGHGGLLDIVEHDVSGLIFKPGDVVGFSDAIEKLITSPKLRTELGMEGCARQERMFSLTEQLDRTVELLEEMMKRKADER